MSAENERVVIAETERVGYRGSDRPRGGESDSNYSGATTTTARLTRGVGEREPRSTGREDTRGVHNENETPSY